VRNVLASSIFVDVLKKWEKMKLSDAEFHFQVKKAKIE